MINLFDFLKRKEPSVPLSQVSDLVAKEVAKDYLTERNEIPEEDRSFKSSDAKAELDSYADSDLNAFKRGGKVKSTAKSKVNSASRRGDGIAQRGKTKGRIC